MVKNKIILLFLILFFNFIFGEETDLIDTGLATDANKPVSNEIVSTKSEVIQTQEQIPTQTQVGQRSEATPASTYDEKVELDTESKDTEGIVILSPGEVEPEILEKYIKYEKPAKEKVDVEEETKILKKETEMGEAEQEITFEYKEAEAEVVLIEGKPKEKIEKAGFLLVEKAGFISQNFVEDGIIFNVFENISLLPGKFVNVNITVGKPIKKGDRLIVYDDSEEVFNPVTDEYVGKMINILGVIKITKKVKDNTYNAKIIKSYGLIKDGNKVKLRKEISDYHSKITRKETKKLTEVEGFIIKAKNKNKDSILHKKDIIYIDKGLEKGIFPGIKMNIIRDDKKRSENEGINIIGQIVVINSMKNNSTAVIISQKDTVKIGDIVRTIK